MYILWSHKKGILLSLLQGVLFRKILAFLAPFITPPHFDKEAPRKKARFALHCVQRRFYSSTKQMRSISHEDKVFFPEICLQFTYSMSFSIFMIQPMTFTSGLM